MAGKTGVKNNGPKPALSKVARDSAVGDLQALIPQLSSALQAFLSEESGESEHQPEANPDATVNTGTENVNDDQGSMENEQPPATPAPAASEGGGDISALIEQAKAILAQLAQATQGSGEAVNEPESEANDTVEGLADESKVTGAQVSTDAEGEGENKPEDQATTAKAQDAALRGFYADLAAKDSFYQRLSAVVGAFDHKAMDSRQVAVYGVKKLGIKCEAGVEPIALDAYLAGHEKAAKATVQTTKNKALDAAVSEQSPELEAYLNGSKQ